MFSDYISLHAVILYLFTYTFSILSLHCLAIYWHCTILLPPPHILHIYTCIYFVVILDCYHLIFLDMLYLILCVLVSSLLYKLLDALNFLRINQSIKSFHNGLLTADKLWLQKAWKKAQKLLLFFSNRATLISVLPRQWKTGQVYHWPVTLELKQFTPLSVCYWNSLRRSFGNCLQSVSDTWQTLNNIAI